ncbi:hypothetical protein QMZ20_13485, partial [Serratia bockelmannii]|nr:hypothetical protein [Serratia bockelmannii]
LCLHVSHNADPGGDKSPQGTPADVPIRVCYLHKMSAVKVFSANSCQVTRTKSRIAGALYTINPLPTPTFVAFRRASGNEIWQPPAGLIP